MVRDKWSSQHNTPIIWGKRCRFLHFHDRPEKQNLKVISCIPQMWKIIHHHSLWSQVMIHNWLFIFEREVLFWEQQQYTITLNNGANFGKYNYKSLSDAAIRFQMWSIERSKWGLPIIEAWYGCKESNNWTKQQEKSLNT